VNSGSDDNNKGAAHRLAAALAVYDGYKPLMQEISDLYERGDFYTADPMQTELNDDLAEVAGKLADAARDLLAEDPRPQG
jgi:hypothetical protein